MHQGRVSRLSTSCADGGGFFDKITSRYFPSLDQMFVSGFGTVKQLVKVV